MPLKHKKTASKTLRVASAGYTADDGRVIKEQWLQDIADTYNAETYGARCWVEHRRNVTADGPFPAIGDVESVYTQTDTINGKETLCLYATVKPLPALLSMNQAGQKIYTSIEVEPNFSNTGKAYLMGLAFTDSPASLGTEALKFNAYAVRQKDRVFSEAVETELKDSVEVAAEFVEGHPQAQPLFTLLAALIASQSAESQSSPDSPPTPVASEPPANDFAASLKSFKSDLSAQFDNRFAALEKQLADNDQQLAALTDFKQKIEATETDTVGNHDGQNSDDIVADC